VRRLDVTRADAIAAYSGIAFRSGAMQHVAVFLTMPNRAKNCWRCYQFDYSGVAIARLPRDGRSCVALLSS
jgi:hypothetical protein